MSEAISVIRLYVADRFIHTLQGIEAFSNLEWLDCSSNPLTEIDINELTNLTYLDSSLY